MKTIDVFPASSSVYTTIPATFFQRAFAWLIDRVVLFFIQLFIVFLFFVFSLPTAAAFDTSNVFKIIFSGLGLTAGLLVAVSWFLYRFFTESRMNGQTFGKRLLGVRVVRENGFPASNADILVREILFVLFSVIPYLNTIIFIVNIILVAFSGKKQALHDMIAKTMVVPA